MNFTIKNIINKLQDIIQFKIDYQNEEENKLLLIEMVKFLSIKLNPCVIETLIINIKYLTCLRFIDTNIQIKLIELLFENKFDILVLNILYHSFPDIRRMLFIFIFEIQTIVFESDNKNVRKQFTHFQSNLKGCFVPEEIFYHQSLYLNASFENIQKLAEHCAKKLRKNPDYECGKFNDLSLIIKEDLMNKYKDWLFSQIFTEVFGYNYSSKPPNKIEQKELHPQSLISLIFFLNKNSNVEELSYFVTHLRNYIQKCNSKNCFILLKNKMIINFLLDLGFLYSFSIQDDNPKHIAQVSYEMITEVFFKSLNYLYIKNSKKKEIHPIDHLEVILEWGDKILNSEKDHDKVYKFITQLLLCIAKKFNHLLKGNHFLDYTNQSEVDIFNKKTYLKYIYFLFVYYTYYKKDNEVILNGMDFINSITTSNDNFIYTSLIIEGMKFHSNCQNPNSLEDFWDDYSLFNEFYHKLKFIWDEDNIYKGKKDPVLNEAFNSTKFQAYIEKFLNEFLLIKESSDLYADELIFLTKHFDKKKNINLLKVFSNTFPMIIITLNTMMKDQAHTKKWIKEYANFIILLIFASTNLSNTYKKFTELTENCIDGIVYGIGFFKEFYDVSNSIKSEIRTNLHKIILISIHILSSQNKGSNEPLFSKRNKLSDKSIFKIFNNFFVNERGENILTIETVNFMKSKENCETIEIILKSKDMVEYFFNNHIFKRRIEKNIFFWNNYQSIVERRYSQISSLTIGIDLSFREKAVAFIKKYQKEILSKNYKLIEKEKEIKLYIKKAKKEQLYFTGMWSDKNLFYNKTDEPTNLKYKSINHLTEEFSKPFLSPFLDYNYYFPKSSAVYPSLLVQTSNKNEEDKGANSINDELPYNFDIDSVLGKVSQKKNITNIRNTIFTCLARKNISLFDKIYFKSKDIFIPENEEICQTMLKSLYEIDYSKERISNSFPCCLVKETHHIRGDLIIHKDNIIFQRSILFDNLHEEVDESFLKKDNKNVCHGSFIPKYYKDKDIISIPINYIMINFFLRRFYYYQQNSIEFYIDNHKSYFFKFDSHEEREKVILLITSMNKQLFSPILDELKTINVKKETFFDAVPNNNFDLNQGNVIGYFSFEWNKIQGFKLSTNKRLKLNKIILKWSNCEISNFKLLMLLNILSNRSYRDLTQYPVFPWVFSNYPSGGIDIKKPENYRDLSVPMGMMQITPQSASRKASFIEVYNTIKEISTSFPFFYGTHYSNPIYTCNFLVRLFPYSIISLKLNGGNLDIPERLFSSVSATFVNATSTKTDVRELIPEFFFLPDMFINDNKINLGQISNKKTIERVITPCGSNPYEFVVRMKKGLESSIVSNRLWDWIDLIFGYKQKGKEGLKAKNIFARSTYIENINLESEKNKEVLMSSIEFGLIPIQLYDRDIGSKMKHKNQHSNVFNLNNQNSETQANIIPCDLAMDNNSTLLAASVFNDDQSKGEPKIVLLFNNNYLYVNQMSYNRSEGKYCSDITKKSAMSKKVLIFKIRRFYSEFYSEYTNHIIFFKGGSCALMGGYSDGKIMFIQINEVVKATAIYPNNYGIPITSLAYISEQRQLAIVCGDAIGNLSIIKMVNQETFVVEKVFHDNSDIITHINYSYNLHCFATASRNGYINLYKVPKYEMINSFRITNDDRIKYVFLSNSPLICLIAYLEYAAKFVSIAINNGKVISELVEEHDIRSPIIVKDSGFFDYLIYISNMSRVVVSQLPELTKIEIIPINFELSLLSFIPDFNLLLGYNKDASKTIVINWNKKK